MLDSAIKVNKRYYPQTLLKECIYIIKNKKMENLINDDLGLRSSNNGFDNEYSSTSEDDSNDESDNESDNDDKYII